MHLLAVVEVAYGVGFRRQGKAVILTGVPTEVFFFAMTGRLWYGGIAYSGLREERHHLRAPANAWLTRHGMFPLVRISMTPLDPWSVGTSCPRRTLIWTGPVQPLSSEVKARPWPAHGAETAPMPCHLVGRVRILVDGPISECGGEGGRTCMKGSM